MRIPVLHFAVSLCFRIRMENVRDALHATALELTFLTANPPPCLCLLCRLSPQQNDTQLYIPRTGFSYVTYQEAPCIFWRSPKHRDIASDYLVEFKSARGLGFDDFTDLAFLLPADHFSGERARGRAGG